MRDDWRNYQGRLVDADREDDRWWLSALGVACVTAALMLAGVLIF